MSVANERQYELRLEGASRDCCRAKEQSAGDGVTLYVIKINFPQRRAVKNLQLKYCAEMKGILSVWSPTARRNRALYQWFAPTESKSDFSYGAPVISAVKDGKNNYCTLALSDGINSHKISLCVNDFAENYSLDFVVTLFTEEKFIEDYEIVLRIDRRETALTETLAGVSGWWDGFYSDKIARVPEQNRSLYSSWYNFHQHPEQKLLEKELEIASELGFRAMIIDDGWQFDGSGSGDYYDCGDWAVSKEKFADLSAFVRKAHELKIKVALWFPVPFVGFGTEAYRKFRNNLLYEKESIRAGILDPRYARVRKFIVGTLTGLVREYGLDGLKLDFIDSFTVTEDTPEANGEMDCGDLREAVVALMDEISRAVTEINPNFLAEFRQDYVGPAIIRYANMLRVVDCAFDSVTNRIGAADLRMMNYSLAVHSDMLYWAPYESAGNCIRQMLNVMFAVPQISVMLTECREEQRLAVKAFLDYKRENSDLLLYGKLTAEGVDAGYSRIGSETDEKRVTVNYSVNDYVFDGLPADVFNATDKEFLTVINQESKKIHILIFDWYGTIKGEYDSEEKFIGLSVPTGGFVKLV